jgi:AcrR family transcriptional regulator
MAVAPSKRRILERAAQLASSHGLEQLTIGRLAEDVGMSKAGLYGHFGSKERLQLETLQLGSEIFQRHVILPAEAAPAGLRRLWALCRCYLDYVERGVFAGGDFWVTVAHEFESRGGPIHDEVESAIGAWMRRLEDLLSTALELGELSPCDPAQVAFEIEALLVAGSHVFRLHGDTVALSHARAGIARRLEELRTPGAPSLEDRAGAAAGAA